MCSQVDELSIPTPIGWEQSGEQATGTSAALTTLFFHYMNKSTGEFRGKQQYCVLTI